MSLWRVVRHLSGLLLIGIAIWAVTAFVVMPSFTLASASREVTAALRDARSVTCSEFITAMDSPDLFVGQTPAQNRLVLRRVAATPEQIARFRAATSGVVQIGFSLRHASCYAPHHGVEIVRKDGSVTRFDVCFSCRNYCFGDKVVRQIPRSWLPRLQEFFTSLGMPPRSSEEYRRIVSARA